MRADQVCGLLAEPDRMAAFAAVVLGAATPDRVAEVTGLPVRRVTTALRRLERGGLVRRGEGGLVADTGVFKQVAREAASAARVDEPPLDPDPSRDAVLRTFIREGRLRRLPAGHRKRRIVLEHLAAAFEPGVKYPEREVDAVLRAWHPDHATLRRYLVDEDLLAREDGVYWRIGGPFVP
ncbi:MAG: DUF2087 domain-containing protein [Micromonosporaceae bacterium]|jgi:hypothetical protein